MLVIGIDETPNFSKGTGHNNDISMITIILKDFKDFKSMFAFAP